MGTTHREVRLVTRTAKVHGFASQTLTLQWRCFIPRVIKKDVAKFFHVQIFKAILFKNELLCVLVKDASALTVRHKVPQVLIS